MKNKSKVNYINTLIAAFEARNEQLHEEIKRNEEAMEEMRSELTQIMESPEILDIPEENKLKMVA